MPPLGSCLIHLKSDVLPPACGSAPPPPIFSEKAAAVAAISASEASLLLRFCFTIASIHRRGKEQESTKNAQRGSLKTLAAGMDMPMHNPSHVHVDGTAAVVVLAVLVSLLIIPQRQVTFNTANDG